MAMQTFKVKQPWTRFENVKAITNQSASTVMLHHPDSGSEGPLKRGYTRTFRPPQNILVSFPQCPSPTEGAAVLVDYVAPGD